MQMGMEEFKNNQQLRDAHVWSAFTAYISDALHAYRSRARGGSNGFYIDSGQVKGVSGEQFSMARRDNFDPMLVPLMNGKRVEIATILEVIQDGIKYRGLLQHSYRNFRYDFLLINAVRDHGAVYLNDVLGDRLQPDEFQQCWERAQREGQELCDIELAELNRLLRELENKKPKAKTKHGRKELTV